MQTLAAARTVLDTLASTTISAAGSSQVALTPAAPVEVDADTAPLLAITFQRVGHPGPFLSANATAAVAAGDSSIVSISYEANGNTLTETRPGGLTSYTW
ncbi:MAG: hypothetical protein IT204_19110, partial [Fimbriimonadaceae bacterium]|nr:hypothetical protein [Fimbriimonadaceae bacterium]